MQVRFKRSFIKDLEKCPVEIKQRAEKLIFVQVPSIQSLTELTNIRKIKGYSNYFRIRMGQYRIGFELRNETLVFYRILHRKDIYKYFP